MDETRNPTHTDSTESDVGESEFDDRRQATPVRGAGVLDARHRKLLDDQRRRAEQQVEALTQVFAEIVAAAEDVATDDEHDPEGHTVAYERQQIAALLKAARRQLVELDDAIDRFETRSAHGICVECRDRISCERLVALPTARLCIDCAR